MREVVTLQIGQCGNQIGNEFWKIVCDEHGVDQRGHVIDAVGEDVGYQDVFYRRVEKDSRCVPRTILVDFEPGVLDAIKGGPTGSLYRPDNFVQGKSGSGNNWATGFYTLGLEFIDQVKDILRQEVEACDCLQGFQMTSSTGGGTGSGFGSLLLSALRDEYPDMLTINTSVLPSAKVSDVIVESYNTVLCLDALLEYSDGVFCLDNEALYKICSTKLRLKKIGYEDLNGLIANVMSGVTTSLRFPGQLNSDIRKLAVNMIPYPRLHFFLTGQSPIVSSDVRQFNKIDVRSITRDLFDPSNVMCDCNPQAGRYLTLAAMYRGKAPMREIDTELLQMRNKHSSYFVEWIPHNAKVSQCDVPPAGERLSATLLANSTSIQEVMRRVEGNFQKMFKRRAYLHWFTMQGMEEDRFSEAQSNLQDLIDQYEQLTNMSVEEDYACCCDDLEDSLEELDSGFGC